MSAEKLNCFERAKSHGSLLCLLQGLQGKRTTVELRNECSVTGFIEHVNGHMDTHMCDVVFKDMFDVETRMEKFFVKGSQIRFVLIPDGVNIISTMEKQLKSLRRAGYLGPQPVKMRGRGRGYTRDKEQMKKDDATGRSSLGQELNLMQRDRKKGKERFEAYMAKIDATKKKETASSAESEKAAGADTVGSYDSKKDPNVS